MEPTGSITGEPAETYYVRQLDVANNTGLGIINKQSAAHFKYWAENPDHDKETPALTFGRAFHCATLEPDVFRDTYVVLPGGSPPRPTQRQWNAKSPSRDSRLAMDWWSNFDHENRGRTIISAADYERCQRMADSIRNHSEAVSGLLVGGQREATLRWTDETTGIECKARLDNYEPCEFILDLKKTIDASPEGFARSVANYLYDQQQAHYREGARVVHGEAPPFVILACEDTPPFVCQPYFIDPMAEERGWKLRQRAMRIQAECLRTGTWPGYSTKFEQLSLPSYSYYSIEDDQ